MTAQTTANITRKPEARDAVCLPRKPGSSRSPELDSGRKPVFICFVAFIMPTLTRPDDNAPCLVRARRNKSIAKMPLALVGRIADNQSLHPQPMKLARSARKPFSSSSTRPLNPLVPRSQPTRSAQPAYALSYRTLARSWHAQTRKQGGLSRLPPRSAPSERHLKNPKVGFRKLPSEERAPTRVTRPKMNPPLLLWRRALWGGSGQGRGGPRPSTITSVVGKNIIV
jgi:hypothetical protein